LATPLSFRHSIPRLREDFKRDRFSLQDFEVLVGDQETVVREATVGCWRFPEGCDRSPPGLLVCDSDQMRAGCEFLAVLAHGFLGACHPRRLGFLRLLHRVLRSRLSSEPCRSPNSHYRLYLHLLTEVAGTLADPFLVAKEVAVPEAVIAQDALAGSMQHRLREAGAVPDERVELAAFAARIGLGRQVRQQGLVVGTA